MLIVPQKDSMEAWKRSFIRTSNAGKDRIKQLESSYRRDLRGESFEVIIERDDEACDSISKIPHGQGSRSTQRHVAVLYSKAGSEWLSRQAR